jgi:chromosome partitioning protein
MTLLVVIEILTLVEVLFLLTLLEMLYLRYYLAEGGNVRTYAVCNQKGGVGKTNTTYHLARAAVLASKRVLAIDLDPQGTLTGALAKESDLSEDIVTVADALAKHPIPLAGVVVEGLWDGLDVAPVAGESLALVRDQMVIEGAGREYRLKEAVSAVDGKYDLVLIDCPPSLDLLTINALIAADAALVITQAKLWSRNGFSRLLDTIADVRRYYNPGLNVEGVIVSQFQRVRTADNDGLSEIALAAPELGLRILEPAIPYRATIGDTAEMRVGLDTADKKLAAIYDGYLTQIGIQQ